MPSASSRPPSSTRTTFGMRDRARARGLGDEARRLRRVGGEVRAQHLDRDGGAAARAASAANTSLMPPPPMQRDRRT